MTVFVVHLGTENNIDEFFHQRTSRESFIGTSGSFEHGENNRGQGTGSSIRSKTSLIFTPESDTSQLYRTF